MLCPACGYVLPATARFCAKCGSRIEPATTPSHSEAAPAPGTFCASCGHPLDPAHGLCGYCGQTVARALQPPPALLPPTPPPPRPEAAAAVGLQLSLPPVDAAPTPA